MRGFGAMPRSVARPELGLNPACKDASCAKRVYHSPGSTRSAQNVSIERFETEIESLSRLTLRRAPLDTPRHRRIFETGGRHESVDPDQVAPHHPSEQRARPSGGPAPGPRLRLQPAAAAAHHAAPGVRGRPDPARTAPLAG